MHVQTDSDNYVMNQESEREVPKYQNTYQLEAYNPFKTDAVDKIVKILMMNELEDISYDAMECPKICELIATNIKKAIKKLNFDRYKIVVNVGIIEKTNQSICTSMGFLWDAARDNYSTYTHEAQTFHAYCCVFGLYYE